MRASDRNRGRLRDGEQSREREREIEREREGEICGRYSDRDGWTERERKEERRGLRPWATGTRLALRRQESQKVGQNAENTRKSLQLRRNRIVGNRPYTQIPIGVWCESIHDKLAIVSHCLWVSARLHVARRAAFTPSPCRRCLIGQQASNQSCRFMTIEKPVCGSFHSSSIPILFLFYGKKNTSVSVTCLPRARGNSEKGRTRSQRTLASRREFREHVSVAVPIIGRRFISELNRTKSISI